MLTLWCRRAVTSNCFSPNDLYRRGQADPLHRKLTPEQKLKAAEYQEAAENAAKEKGRPVQPPPSDAKVENLDYRGLPKGKDWQPIKNSTAKNKLGGKTVVVQTTTQTKYVLEKVRIVKSSGESFLVGTGIKWSDDELKKNPSLNGDWWQGLPVRVNLRFVESYSPMTAQQWKNYMERVQPTMPWPSMSYAPGR